MFFTLATFVFRSNILIRKNFSQKSVKRFIDQIDHKMNKKYPSIRNWASAALPGNIIKNPLICLIWINIGQLIYHYHFHPWVTQVFSSETFWHWKITFFFFTVTQSLLAKLYYGKIISFNFFNLMPWQKELAMVIPVNKKVDWIRH